MPIRINGDPILKRLRAARGDAHEDSDYDVAVFLDNLTGRRIELDRLAELRIDMLDEIDAFIDCIDGLL